LGDFNYWDGRKHQMRKGATGIWELFIPEIGVGEHYKYEIKNYDGHIYEKSDPMASSKKSDRKQRLSLLT
jgi:1,4-alpha-glucan branching enzyme